MSPLGSFPRTASSPTSSTRRAVLRALARHRRGLAALSAAVAVIAVIGAVRPDPVATTPIVVATRDMPAGSTPGPSDVAVVDMPTALRPAGVLRAARQARGVALTGPIRRGEPLTDVRVTRTGTAADSRAVALPARFADADAVAVLRPGDRIDVLLAPPPEHPGPARRIVVDAVVVARPTPGTTASGALVILEVPSSAVAFELAGVATGPGLTYIIRGFASSVVAKQRE